MREAARAIRWWWRRSRLLPAEPPLVLSRCATADSEPTVRNVALCVNLNQCDLKCIMCWTVEDRARETPHPRPWNLPRASLLDLLRSPELRDVDSVSIVGGGEPFVYPYIDDVLREGPTTSRRLMIMTHGGLLHRRPYLWEAAREKRLTLMFSLDAASPGTYANIRRGGDWATVMANIERFVALRSVNPELVTTASYVVLEQNLDEVLPFLQLCASWKASYVHFHPAIAGNYPEEWRVDRTSERYLRTMERAIDFARENDIALDRPEELVTEPDILEADNPPAATNSALPDPRRSCRLHSEGMTIDIRGDVYVCDTAFRLPYACGNVLRDGVKGAWESTAWRSLREAHRQGRPESHPLCARCLLIR